MFALFLAMYISTSRGYIEFNILDDAQAGLASSLDNGS